MCNFKQYYKHKWNDPRMFQVLRSSGGSEDYGWCSNLQGVWSMKTMVDLQTRRGSEGSGREWQSWLTSKSSDGLVEPRLSSDVLECIEWISSEGMSVPNDTIFLCLSYIIGFFSVCLLLCPLRDCSSKGNRRGSPQLISRVQIDL